MTNIQGLEEYENIEIKGFLKKIKKKLCCNGCIIDHKEYGNVLQFQGDKRNEIKDILVKYYEIDEKNVEVHGY